MWTFQSLNEGMRKSAEDTEVRWWLIGGLRQEKEFHNNFQAFAHFLPGEMISFFSSCGCRKTVQKGKLMDFTSTVIIPLLFGSLGIFALFRLLQWMRTRAYLQEAVVVITGATSGLGKGMDQSRAPRAGQAGGCGRSSSWDKAEMSWKFLLIWVSRCGSHHSQRRFGLQESLNIWYRKC